MIRALAILIVSAGTTFAETPKMGRILAYEDHIYCKKEASIARGYVIIRKDDAIHENAQVTLHDFYGDYFMEQIGFVTNALQDWTMDDGEMAEQVFMGLCYLDRIGSIGDIE